MKKVLLTIVCVIFIVAANAQITIKGKVNNGADTISLLGASVVVKDTTGKYITGMSTANNGTFFFKDIDDSAVILNVSYIGYKAFEKKYVATGSQINIGTIVLYEESTNLNSVEIQDKAPATVQKGDTTEMSASSYKVNTDATTQDLVQ